MESTNDGFEIADEDLILRGPGEYVGFKQSGFVKYKIADMVTDGPIIRTARILAKNIIGSDPTLKNHENVKTQVLKVYKNNLHLVKLN
jgi:ATP-dependent DNA helicase RecG